MWVKFIIIHSIKGNWRPPMHYLIILCFLVFMTSGSIAAELLPPGTQAKRFLIMGMDGKRSGLRDYIKEVPEPKDAKLIIMSFWSLSCVPCRTEIPILEQFAAMHPEEVKLLLVNLDNKESRPQIEAYIKEFNMKQTVLLDFYQTTGKAYQVCENNTCNVPALYGLNQKGDIVFALQGFDASKDFIAYLNQQLAVAKGSASTAIAKPAATPSLSEKKFEILHQALIGSPIDAIAVQHGMKREEVIKIFMEAETAAKKSWNLN
jgi:thiol-disulfide isomerase/thioredoxin